jgi:hypothetical protein
MLLLEEAGERKYITSYPCTAPLVRCGSVLSKYRPVSFNISRKNSNTTVISEYPKISSNLSIEKEVEVIVIPVSCVLRSKVPVFGE